MKNPYESNPIYFEAIKEIWDIKASNRVNDEANKQLSNGKKYHTSHYKRQVMINKLENVLIILAIFMVSLCCFWLGICFAEVMK